MADLTKLMPALDDLVEEMTRAYNGALVNSLNEMDVAVPEDSRRELERGQRINFRLYVALAAFITARHWHEEGEFGCGQEWVEDLGRYAQVCEFEVRQMCEGYDKEKQVKADEVASKLLDF